MVTTVTLAANGETRQFEIQHAERILNYQIAGGISSGWRLADPDYTFRDGTIVRANTGTAEEPKKQSGNSGRRKPRGKDSTTH